MNVKYWIIIVLICFSFVILPVYLRDIPKLISYVSGEKDCISYYVYSYGGQVSNEYGIACEGDHYYCNKNNKTCYDDKDMRQSNFHDNPIMPYILLPLFFLVLLWLLNNWKGLDV